MTIFHTSELTPPGPRHVQVWLSCTAGCSKTFRVTSTEFGGGASCSTTGGSSVSCAAGEGACAAAVPAPPPEPALDPEDPGGGGARSPGEGLASLDKGAGAAVGSQLPTIVIVGVVAVTVCILGGCLLLFYKSVRNSSGGGGGGTGCVSE